jgi:hypothetical protein
LWRHRSNRDRLVKQLRTAPDIEFNDASLDEFRREARLNVEIIDIVFAARPNAISVEACKSAPRA